jgi:hypothetical protein
MANYWKRGPARPAAEQSAPALSCLFGDLKIHPSHIVRDRLASFEVVLHET